MITTASMGEASKSAWCREHGVYPAELDKWRSSCTAALAEPEEARATPQATRQDRKRIKELERDLLRKGPSARRDCGLAGLVKKSRGDLQQRRGRMIGLEDRQALARDIDVAHGAGARLRPACQTAGIELRTLQRWKAQEGLMAGDGRPHALRPLPSHALSQGERARLLAVANEPRFAAVPPALYLILDLYSRKVVGWEVHETDDSDHAAHLVRRTALAEGIAMLTSKPVLHGDNGSTLKATTVLAMLNWLGVKPSYSRPRVSDDNAYAESLFRTAKYRPEFPAKGFTDLDAARAWAAGFVHWYNVDHRHSGIRYVSPAQRHAGQDRDILDARHALYSRARESNPARWSRNTRNWTPIDSVTLNPERDSVVNAHAAHVNIEPLAA